MVFALHAVI